MEEIERYCIVCRDSVRVGLLCAKESCSRSYMDRNGVIRSEPPAELPLLPKPAAKELLKDNVFLRGIRTAFIRSDDD